MHGILKVCNAKTEKAVLSAAASIKAVAAVVEPGQNFIDKDECSDAIVAKGLYTQ